MNSDQDHRLNLQDLEDLLRVVTKLNSSLDVDTVLGRVLDAARDLSQADRATLYMVDNDRRELWTHVFSGPSIETFRMPMTQGVAGHVATTGMTSNLKEARRSSHHSRELEERLGYQIDTMMTVAIRDRDRHVIGVIQVINATGSPKYFDERTELLLSHLGDAAAIALQNAYQLEQIKEKRRIEADLLAAERIQHHMLPSSLPQGDGFQVAAAYVPCDEVGGDCYDCFVREDGVVGFALGDITGHGVSAALMMTNLQALFRLESRRSDDPGTILNAMNQSFYITTAAHHFATFACGFFDPGTGTVKIASAGHDPLLIAAPDSTLTDGPTGGVLLGILPDSTYTTHELQLPPDAVFLLYSDGITESADSKNRLLGRECLGSMLVELRASSPGSIVEAVMNAVENHTSPGRATDDVTLLVLARR